MSNPYVLPGISTLDGFEITNDLSGLVTIGATSSSVTVRTVTATTRNATTGVVSETATSDAVTGYLSDLGGAEVAGSPLYEVGDIACTVMAADLTGGHRPTPASTTVTISSVVYEVVDVNRDPVSATWRMTLRLPR